MVVLIVYSDDIVITRNDFNYINKLKTSLAIVLMIKDLESLNYFLGIEVARSKKGTIMSQRKYILDLFKEIGIQRKSSGYKLSYLKSFVVCLVSQFMHSTHEKHLEAIYKVLTYLKNDLSIGLCWIVG
ncbi:hypothetical protein CR513_06360, partial [Mucuna pruriens]